MNKDIRISTSFKGHRKRKRLQRLLGSNSDSYLIDLWLTVAMDCPSGELKGWDETDIADAAGWNKDPLLFVDALVSTRWLEKNISGNYSIHDWVEHNGYASDSEKRSDKARLNRMAKTFPALYDKLRSEGRSGISSNEYNALTNKSMQRINGIPTKINGVTTTFNDVSNDVTLRSDDELTSVLSPSPSPSPSAKSIHQDASTNNIYNTNTHAHAPAGVATEFQDFCEDCKIPRVDGACPQCGKMEEF